MTSFGSIMGSDDSIVDDIKYKKLAPAFIKTYVWHFSYNIFFSGNCSLDVINTCSLIKGLGGPCLPSVLRYVQTRQTCTSLNSNCVRLASCKCTECSFQLNRQRIIQRNRAPIIFQIGHKFILIRDAFLAAHQNNVSGTSR